MEPRDTEPDLEDPVIESKIKIVVIALIIASLLGLVLSTAHGESIPGWRDDVTSAFEEAKTSGTALILLISTDGCEACTQFAEEAGKASAISSALTGIAKVQADASLHPDLVRRYAAEGTPTIVVFSPATGYETPAYTHTGVLDAGELVRLADTVRPQNAQVPQDPGEEPSVESANPDTTSPEQEQDIVPIEQDIIPLTQHQNHATAPGKPRVLDRLLASVGKLGKRTARIVR